MPYHIWFNDYGKPSDNKIEAFSFSFEISQLAGSLELDKWDFHVKHGSNKLFKESKDIYFRRHIQSPIMQINILLICIFVTKIQYSIEACMEACTIVVLF